MHLQQMWHQFLAEQGNEPGQHQGKVTITLLTPVGGIGELTVPSNEVAFAAEAGSLVGLLVTLPTEAGPRRLFIGGGNVAGVIDTAAEEDTPPPAKKTTASRSKSAAAGT
jgi:hypothetical protein